jgi:hypothetical protein
MKIKNPIPKPGTKGFLMAVMPERKYLENAIALEANCRPERCWHKLAIAAVAIAWGENNSRVLVDAGHVRLNFRGWRYRADTPRHVKRSLMLFDRKLYDQVHIREYNLRFRRTTKIVAISQKRQEQINAARRKREAAGKRDQRHYPNMHDRVVGFSASV